MRGEGRRISHLQIPLALRVGAGRAGWSLHDSYGCVGEKGQGILLGATGARCNEKDFGVLEYLGNDGDPPLGTAVSIFPKCSKLEDIYNPLSGCIPAELVR